MIFRDELRQKVQALLEERVQELRTPRNVRLVLDLGWHTADGQPFPDAVRLIDLAVPTSGSYTERRKFMIAVLTDLVMVAFDLHDCHEGVAAQVMEA